MYEKQKREILEACMKLKEYRLISLTGGNVSVIVDDNRYLVTPSGMLYEKMSIDDIVLVDHECNVIEGTRKPSSDIFALIHIFDHLPVKAIIHTHQPYATAVGFNNDSLPACMVTLIDAAHARINVAPFTPSQDVGMGELAVKYANDATAIIMKHHGLIAYGKNLEEALYSAVYIEEAAKTYCIARIMGPVPELTDEEIAKEAAGWQNYGQ